MSNPTSASMGPWWFTAIVAGITGITALATGAITTLLASAQANKRLMIELEHRHDLEREKLLFERRYDLYLKVSKFIQKFRGMYIELFAGDSKMFDIRAANVDLQLDSIRDEFNAMHGEAGLVASKEMLGQMRDIRSHLNRLENALHSKFTITGNFRIDLINVFDSYIHMSDKIKSVMSNDLGKGIEDPGRGMYQPAETGSVQPSLKIRMAE